MALSEFDRNLVDRCLQKQPQAWEEFVDRFAGLVSFVVRSTCMERSISLDPNVQDDLVQEVFVAILSNNFVVLRRFRGNSSLAAYLTVISRRVVVKSLLEKYLPMRKKPVAKAEDEEKTDSQKSEIKKSEPQTQKTESKKSDAAEAALTEPRPAREPEQESIKMEEIPEPTTAAAEAYIENMDEILYLISNLSARDAKVVKMYHLEQKTYAEIAAALGISENTVGPILSRARETMRQKG